jgi:hypothetical protein
MISSSKLKDAAFGKKSLRSTPRHSRRTTLNEEEAMYFWREASDQGGLEDSYKATKREIMAKHSLQREVDMTVTFSESIHFMVESAVALNPNCPFFTLLCLSVILVGVFGQLWTRSLEQEFEAEFQPFPEDWEPHILGIDMAFQVLMSGGYTEWANVSQMALVWAMIISGLLIFSVFLGYVTDSFSTYMAGLSEGRSKVPLRGHVLILGWNEATVRLVCQLAFLRQQLDNMNSSIFRRYIPFLRVKGATPVASAQIVVVCKSMPCRDMARILREAIQERGIKGVQVGRHVVVSEGDPSNLHDLARVGAMRARRIIIMETARDEEEFDLSDGKVQNGATLRAILSLRHLMLMADQKEIFWDGQFPLQIVAQLNQGSDCVEACNFRSPEGRHVVTPMYLTEMLNSLLFACVPSPGLANVLMELLSFQGVAIRCRVAAELPEVVGKKVNECDFLWESATFLGYIDPVDETLATNGLCPEEVDHVILSTDIVLYAAREPAPAKAQPALYSDLFRKSDAERPPARDRPAPKEEEEEERDDAARLARHDSFDASSGVSSILICGWRHDWCNKTRFRKRLEELIKQCWPGSHIHFLCMLEREKFLEILELNGVDVSQTTESGGWAFEHVEIGHTSGDSSSFQDLKKTLTSRTFSAIVVLGTVADVDLDKILTNYSRDTRVLRTILGIRQLHHMEGYTHPVHILGENAENVTSLLAPVADPAGTSNDFVNTHAMFARTLAQALCFPKLYSALIELLSYDLGTPRIVIVPADNVVNFKEPTLYARVVRQVRKLHSEDTCLGYFLADNSIHLSPALGSSRTFQEGDRIILLTRRMTSVELYLNAYK